MSSFLQKFKLKSNPFEPAATGAPLFGELAPPAAQQEKLLKVLDENQTGEGVKSIIIVGDYGLGKTSLLQWLHKKVLPERVIRSFYFDNPGVQFYHLANQLLRTIGRKDFAKFIWELAASHVTDPYQPSLFEEGFEEYLSSFSQKAQPANMAAPIQQALRRSGLAEDEQIAHCLARIVTEYGKKPYFEYRDFVPSRSGNIVAEGEEAPYFRAILKTISAGLGENAIAFLIDEFEEIGLQKRLTRRQAHDYLATLKRLINLAHNEQVDFWIVLSMTPDAYDKTLALEPSLLQRVRDQVLHIEGLTEQEARVLVRTRLRAVRTEKSGDWQDSLFPFPETLTFPVDILSNPRELVKSCYRAISRADEYTNLPFTAEYLHQVAAELYPAHSSIERQRS